MKPSRSTTASRTGRKPAAKAAPAKKSSGAAPDRAERRPKALPPRAPVSFPDLQTDWPDHAHPGTNLTVGRILQIFRDAEDGYPAEQCYLFDDVIERDGNLRCAHDGRIESVAGYDWNVIAGGDDPADARAADLLEDAMQRVPNTRKTIEHWLTLNGYGYAGSRIIWDLLRNGPIAPVWFDNVEPHRFIFEPKTGEPRIVVSQDRWEGEPLEPGAWLFGHRRHWSTPRAGLMRTAVFYAFFKSHAFRDWVIANERYGIPFPYITYDDDTTDEEKEVMKKAVSLIGKIGYAIFHRSGEINTIDTKGSGSSRETFQPLIDECNREIAKLFTGATLTSGEGTSAGSYALGRVHENVSYTLKAADAQLISEMFEQQIGVPFVAWNGLNCRPPKLRIHISKTSDPAARMDLYCQGANELGLEYDPDQVYQDFQFKKPPGFTAKTIKGTGMAKAKPAGAPGEVPN